MIGRVQIYIYLQQMEFISAFAKNIMGMFTFPSCRQYHGDLVESGMYKGKDPSFIQAKASAPAQFYQRNFHRTGINPTARLKMWKRENLNGKSLFTSWQELHDEIEVCGVLQDRVHLNPHQIHLHRRFHHQPHLEAVIHLDHPLVVSLNENVPLGSHVGNLSVVLVW